MISTNLEQVQGVVGATQEWGWRVAFLIKAMDQHVQR